ncbi:MAG: Fic family protein [Ruminococcus sp.]|jgi:Fic family protein|nr:Fic family protein [Ruminococcus sp.]
MWQPKYKNTDRIVNAAAKTEALADVLTITSKITPKLRRENRILSIASSCAIEQNVLTLEQVKAVIDGKPVLAPPKDIREVQNAFEAYEKMLAFNPYDIDDLEAAHRIMMKDLVGSPGNLRTGNIGVVRGDEVIHIAPKPDDVSGKLADLLLWTKKTSAHPLIKSSVFHYEFEFIHPFADGNGRMGRMWQTLILAKWKKIFAWLPVENIVKEHQAEYYKAIEDSNNAGSSTPFIEFMLESIFETLQYYNKT